jgi:hypothetical protein
MIMYTPWFLAIGCEVMILGSRLITNRRLLTGAELPTWVSLLNVVGFIGLVVTFCWSIVSIGWWGPIPIVLLYLLSNFVPSVAAQVLTNPNIRAAAAMQQAADELSDVPPGPEKITKVQERTREILGIKKENSGDG